MSKTTVRKVKLSDIAPPTLDVRNSINPDSIRELAESIKAIGLQNPIILRDGGPPYEITSGHRRYLACKMLGFETIDAIIREFTDEDQYLARLSENIIREDLSPLEQAKAFKIMHDRYKMKLKDIAKKIGKSIPWVKMTMDILDQPEFVQRAVHEGKVSWWCIQPLTRIDDEEMKHYYFRYAIENGITRKVADQWLDGYFRMKDIERERRERVNIIDQRPSAKTYMQCAACREPTDVETMRMIYMCTRCYEYIVEGKELE